MKHRISAGAIVEEDGRILLVRHMHPGRYDFWVAPGGGVVGDEDLADAAAREVREESGLEVQPLRLLYIEELLQPGIRHCKFWFAARLCGGTLNIGNQAAASEFIAEAAWLSRAQLEGKTVFPPVLAEAYWDDKARALNGPIHLGLRPMAFW
jgi:8-oxo-dGTP diphosphatase